MLLYLGSGDRRIIKRMLSERDCRFDEHCNNSNCD